MKTCETGGSESATGPAVFKQLLHVHGKIKMSFDSSKRRKYTIMRKYTALRKSPAGTSLSNVLISYKMCKDTEK